MSIEVEHKCKDYGEEGCLGTPDPNFTMRFDDIGEEPILWCSHCGARASVMQQFIEGWLCDENRTQEDILWLKSVIEKAEADSLGAKS